MDEFQNPNNYESTTTTKTTLEAVENFLEKVYSAKKSSLKEFEELKNDRQVQFDRIVSCYEVTSNSVLQSIFTDAEMKLHQEYRNEITQTSLLSAWGKINTGQLLRITLESEDGITLSNFSVQGLCIKLVNDLSFLMGFKVNDLT